MQQQKYCTNYVCETQIALAGTCFYLNINILYICGFFKGFCIQLN